MLVNTVANNQTSYTNEDYLRANQARELQIKIGQPSLRDYIRIVSENYLPDCPVTKADILAAENMFGPDVGSLKGKTTRCNPHAVRQVVEPLEPHVMHHNRNVMICADVMFVHIIPFFVMISRHIKFGTIQSMADRKQGTLMGAIKAVLQVYRWAGFVVMLALMDGEFDGLQGKMVEYEVVLNTTAQNKHVGEVEQYIRTIKERMRAIYSTLPYRNIPPWLVIEMAKSAVFWLNAFPQQNGIGGGQSPRAIIVGTGIDFTKHCKYQFGEYVHTPEERDNTMAMRTFGALALRPTRNAQGRFYFFSLSTGRVITQGQATSLPMPDDVIDQVHQIAHQQKSNLGMIFENRNNIQLAPVSTVRYYCVQCVVVIAPLMGGKSSGRG